VVSGMRRRVSGRSRLMMRLRMVIGWLIRLVMGRSLVDRLGRSSPQVGQVGFGRPVLRQSIVPPFAAVRSSDFIHSG
jgi:hypothetical protein